MNDEKELPRSKKCAAKVLFSVLTILSENGGEMPLRNLMKEVGHDVEWTPWEIARYETTGAIRWQSILSFYSINCVKAGFLIKKKGVWYLTKLRKRRCKTGACRIA